MTKAAKPYANQKDPVIAAVISGLYSFKSENDAVLVLKQIKDSYIISNAWPSSDKDLVIWIRGFEVSEKEEKKGAKGNFSSFKVEKSSNKKFTIKAEKLEAELSKHPERKYQKHQHPNWGHPVLRGVKKRKQYSTIEAAEKDLRFLQEEFPLVTIPAPGKLYTMVFEKPENSKPGVNKYILEIKADLENKFFIDYCENIREKKQELPLKQLNNLEVKPALEAVGAHSSNVLLKRAQKMRSKKPKPSIKDIINKKS